MLMNLYFLKVYSILLISFQFFRSDVLIIQLFLIAVNKDAYCSYAEVFIHFFNSFFLYIFFLQFNFMFVINNLWWSTLYMVIIEKNEYEVKKTLLRKERKEYKNAPHQLHYTCWQKYQHSNLRSSTFPKINNGIMFVGGNTVTFMMQVLLKISAI